MSRAHRRRPWGIAAGAGGVVLADTILWTAHGCRAGEGVSAPWLTMADLRDLDTTLTRIDTGQARSEGVYPRSVRVNDQMILKTRFPWNDR